MGEPHVLYELKEHVAVITLNRPEAKNAFSIEMITLWNDYLKKARDEANVRVILVTGKGDTFCSGGDIQDMADGRLRSWDMKNFLWEGVHRIVLSLEDLDKPVIAAINGAAMGGGLELAISCTLRVIAESAKMALPEVKLGIIPGTGGTQRLPRLIGKGRAAELLLTGAAINAQDAYHMGLVNKVEPDNKVVEAAEELAAEGIELELIDLRSLKPLDKERIVRSVSKTGRVLILHESPQTAGFGAELAAVVAESEAFDYLDAPIRRLAGRDIPIPYNRSLERATVPQVADIVEAARDLARQGR